MEINGGFFWGQKKGAIKIIDGDKNSVISNCVMLSRPKWYQFRSWYNAIKLWLNLPYSKQIGMKYRKAEFRREDGTMEEYTIGEPIYS